MASFPTHTGVQGLITVALDGMSKEAVQELHAIEFGPFGTGLCCRAQLVISDMIAGALHSAFVSHYISVPYSSAVKCFVLYTIHYTQTYVLHGIILQLKSLWALLGRFIRLLGIIRSREKITCWVLMSDVGALISGHLCRRSLLQLLLVCGPTWSQRFPWSGGC